jgi:hypothetical protein
MLNEFKRRLSFYGKSNVNETNENSFDDYNFMRHPPGHVLL